MAFKKLKNCLACNSNKLSRVLDLNKQPLANSFLINNKTIEKKYELKVNVCENCTHLQLSIAVNPNKIYKRYDYVSGTTQTYKDYMKKFYIFCIRNNKKLTYRNILDIGCNDGSQLDIFKSNKFKTYGVDPAKNIYKIASKKHQIICNFFTEKVISKLPKKFDFIISQNSFAHNPNPVKFLNNAKKLMHDESILVIQTSQADMCKNFEFDTIYHEHINFFNLKSMMQLLKRVNLKLHNVIKNPIHGSSYLFVIRLNSNQKKIRNLIKKEKFLDKNYYINWGKKCKVIAKNIKYKVQKISKKNTVIGYGAAAKANTFLNFTKLKFEFIIDDNKFKQNKFCPGSKIPIRSINFLKQYKKDIYLVPLAWNFFKEIKQRVKRSRKKNNDKFVICYPKFKIY